MGASLNKPLCSHRRYNNNFQGHQGRWFWHQSKTRIWFPIGPQ